MVDLNYYNEEKRRIIEDIGNYISGLRKCKEILNSVKLTLLNFDEFTGKLDGIVKSLIDDKVRISVIAEVSNGKSTFLNALIFKDNILEARIGETTARLYRISYGEEYAVKYSNSEKKFNNLDEIKRFIKQLNDEALEKVEKSKNDEVVFNIPEDELGVFIYIPLEHLKNGIEIIDTPGFGTLNEESMMKLINEAIYLSDAVITILDISQGIKKSESENFSKLLSMIKPDKRYVVFNKIDAYEGEEGNFESVSKDVIDNMNKILKTQGYDQRIDIKQLFYISSKIALQGFTKKVKGEKIDDKTKKYMELFEKFEREFWNDVINYKQKDFLSDKISSFERIKDSINKEVNSIYKNLMYQLSSIKAEKDAISREQLAINSMSYKLKQKANNCLNELRDIELDADVIISDTVNDILQKSRVIDYIEKHYGFWSSIFKKDEIEEEINLRLKEVDIKDIIKMNIDKYYAPIFEDVKNSIDDYNKEVDEFNTQLERMGIKRFKFPRVEYHYENQVKGLKFESKVEVERSNILSPILGWFTGAIIGNLLEEATLGVVLGPAGFIASLMLGAFFASKNADNKKAKLKQKVREGIYNSLYDLRKQIDKLNSVINDYMYHIESKFKEVEYISSEIMKMFEKSDLDERIEDIENQLNALKSIADVLKIQIVEEA